MRVIGIIKKIFTHIEMMNPIKYGRKIGVTIGEKCSFTTCPNWGTEPYLISIGNHVRLSGDVMFITHDGGTWVFRQQEKYKKVIRYGSIKISDNCFIGTRTILLPNIVIGENVVIGAGSVVTKSVPAGEVWAGNPARFICKTKDYAEKCLAETPDYDINNYFIDPQDEIKKIARMVEIYEKNNDAKNR